MGGQDHAHAVGSQRGHQIAHHHTPCGVDAGGGFVQKGHPGAAHQRQGQRQSLLFTARQLAPGGAHAVGEANALNERGGFQWIGVVRGVQPHGLTHSHLVGDATHLEHHPDVIHQPAVVGHRVQPAYPNRA